MQSKQGGEKCAKNDDEYHKSRWWWVKEFDLNIESLASRFCQLEVTEAFVFIIFGEMFIGGKQRHVAIEYCRGGGGGGRR